MPCLWRIDQYGDNAGMSKGQCFFQELIFIGHGRALLQPMSPDDSGKWTIAMRDQQISRYTLAFVAGIVKLDHHYVAMFLNVGFAYVQRRFRVITVMRQ